MNIAQIADNLEKLFESFNKENFIFDLLLAYGTPKATISRLQQSEKNLFSNAEDSISIKKKLYFKSTENQDLQDLMNGLKNNEKVIKNSPRFIVVTDYENLLGYDTKTDESLDIPILDIPRYYDFFLPWAGMEKYQQAIENTADVKAAERMAKLYDEISKENTTNNSEEVHNLNVFLSRLLFCFFAEDTGIFEKSIFTHSIDSHTQKDGSDLNIYLDTLFEILNTNNSFRSKDIPAYLNAFPYVNGGLFRNNHAAPMFTHRSRQMLIDSGGLQWQDINPDIFGSMIQAVITPEHRSGLGMHYTSVPNIMKVIEPLFLNELKESFESSKGNIKNLNALLQRIWKIKIFDPACGSGNFLIIAYKELRQLEMLIFKEIDFLKGRLGSKKIDFEDSTFSEIKLGNFYGIELDDFAHEIATLSLWLAEHQMNQEFMKEFGRAKPALPLQETGNIVHDNACRVDWESVCPKEKDDEIYILGNPPYLGFNERNNEQKEDMDFALINVSNIQRLDYIGCWFVKATDYIHDCNSRYSFVSTNSICQGEQVSLIWPYVFSKNQEIYFAFESFKWSNNAKAKAAVICVIVGVQNTMTNDKNIYSNNKNKKVKSISPYLVEGGQTIVQQRIKTLSNFPEMGLGSSGIDGGHLILSKNERNLFINSESKSEKFIKPFAGGQDFLDRNERYCLWIDDTDIDEAQKIPLIRERIENCKTYRLTAGRDAKKAASVPHRFFYRKYRIGEAIILPMTSSERRKYIPIGHFVSGTIFSNGVFVIYNPETFMFGVLSSNMHMSWVRITSGRLKMDFRYSVNLTYNNFPFPTISNKQKKELEQHVYNILNEREKHSEKTLAQLYDPDKMPDGLREAHRQNDLAIERCYRSKPFESDEERLEYLFKLYEQMIEEEKEKGTLFEKSPKFPKKGT